METVGPTDVERLLRQRESLREVIESISGELELRPLLTRIVTRACELLEAQHGSIGLYASDSDAIEIAAGFGSPRARIGERIPPGAGVAGQVLLTRKPVVVERYGSMESVVWPELADNAVVGVPILWGERLVGFFGVGAAPPRRFDAHDVEALVLFARHAAIAIENARRYEREQRRTERLALIARIGQIVTAGLELDEVLENAARALHALLGYSSVALGVVDAEDSGRFVIRAVGGDYGSVVPGRYRQPVSRGIAGAAIRERRVQLVNDVAGDPRYVPTPGRTGVRAELAVPIVLEDEVLGVVNVESRDPFADEDATGLQIVADHLAVAIGNARLYELEQRRTERLALIARIGQIISAGLDLDVLLQTTADAIHELLGYPNVDIPMLEPREPAHLVIRARGGHYGQVISGEYRLPVTRGVMGAAVRERRVQLVNDVGRDPRYVRPSEATTARAELAVPILLGEQVLGVLNVESDAPFTEEDATSLRIVADHLAVAVCNARLYECAQQVAVLEERQRLARDLHDSVNQLLFSVALIAQSIGPAWRRSPAEGERHLERLLELTRSALAEMRVMLAELRPAEPVHELPSAEGTLTGSARIRQEGLASALRRHATEMSAGALQVEVDTSGYVAQSFDHEEVLYRIAQEALSNVVKHARARAVRVSLSAEGGEATLAVSDDGVGFDPSRSVAKARPGSQPVGGFGLISMRERVEALHGTFRIRSRRGAGTTIEVAVPRKRAGP